MTQTIAQPSTTQTKTFYYIALATSKGIRSNGRCCYDAEEAFALAAKMTDEMRKEVARYGGTTNNYYHVIKREREVRVMHRSSESSKITASDWNAFVGKWVKSKKGNS